MNDHNHILANDNPDGVDRRGFLKCMAWAGTGVLWTISGGVLTSKVLGAVAAEAAGGFSFVQISDSHIGFNKEANKDVIGTLQKAISKINGLPAPPDFILHTGDLSHLSEAGEFDALEQNLKSIKTGEIFYVPGEDDVGFIRAIAFQSSKGSVADDTQKPGPTVFAAKAFEESKCA